MRTLTATLGAVLGIVVSAALAHCALVTNLNTTGYSLAEAGAEGSAGGMCDAGDGACLGLYVGCTSSADCAEGGVCCLVANSFSSFSETCQSAVCSGGLFSVQGCLTNVECGTAGCIKQTCVVDLVPITFSACGSIPGCTTAP